MPLPSVLQIRPTTNCPARCATCTTLVDRRAPDMTLEDVEANLDFFTERHGVTELVFSGAEITLRPDFREILERVRRRGYRQVTLISSGLAWTEERAALCAGVIDRVVMALTPASPEDWRSSRGRSARVRDGIALLQRAGVKVQSNTVLTAASVVVLAEIATAIEAFGIEEPIFLFPFATGGAAAVAAAEVPRWPAIEAVVSEVLESLEARQPRLKNVPPCVALSLARFVSRTRQRILVEHDRQLERHALIPPFVGMRFAAECSGCALEPRCDGYWPAHVDAGVLSGPRPRTVLEVLTAAVREI